MKIIESIKASDTRNRSYIAAIMFMAGAFTYAMLDYLGTPSVEETAAWKAKESLEMETEAKMAEILLQSRCVTQ
jgi:hypothetical protein